MEIRWIPAAETSCLYAAQQLLQGNAAALPPSVVPMAEALGSTVTEAGIELEAFWAYALPLSPAFSDARQLARMILYRCLDAEASRSISADRLQAAFDQLQGAYREEFPDAGFHLTLRTGPLREAWEARGPGLLRGIAEETDARLIAPKADCLIVDPVSGGGGQPHLLYNSVVFEAMLASPLAELPEVVRLAWLLSQLNCDLPMFSEALPDEHIPTLAAASMVIPTLAAAANVELVQFGDELLALAIEQWQIAPEIDGLAGNLTTWWNAYVQTRPPWSIAVSELDRMLFPSGE